MKKLQDDFTTINQSKRLLEIGVPVKSANYKHPLVGACDGTCVLDLDMVVNCDYLCDGEIPLWSAGRLIEIWNICANIMPGMQLDLDKDPENCTYIELIIASFELAADDSLIDFSKLEE